MRITTQGNYGLACVLRIAQQSNGHPVSIQTISKKEQLSTDYIEQLLLKLRRAGIVSSLRGRMGGYILAKPTCELTIKDIVEAVEGGLFETICDQKNHRKNRCFNTSACLAKPVWMELKKRIDSYLKSVTLKDLLNSK